MAKASKQVDKEKKRRRKAPAENPSQGELKSKEQMGRELTEKAKMMLDPDKRNLLEVGKICHTFKHDEDLWRSMGFNGYDEWASDTFGIKGKKTAYRNRKIYENCTGYFEDDQILGIGQIRAFAFSRLPESERAKDEWKDAALHEDSTTFQRKVRDFLKGSPDHREGFCKWGREIPKSLKLVADRVLEGYGNVLRAEDPELKEDWQILEVIFTEIEQEHQDNPNWKHPEADAEVEAEAEEEKSISEDVKEQLGETEGLNPECGHCSPFGHEPSCPKSKLEVTVTDSEPEDVQTCKSCGRNLPVLMEPANFVPGKLRRLDKASLDIRRQMGTSFGYICGDCVSERTQTEEPETEECATSSVS